MAQTPTQPPQQPRDIARRMRAGAPLHHQREDTMSETSVATDGHADGSAQRVQAQPTLVALVAEGPRGAGRSSVLDAVHRWLSCIPGVDVCPVDHASHRLEFILPPDAARLLEQHSVLGRRGADRPAPVR